jgi:hypothetical protein
MDDSDEKRLGIDTPVRFARKATRLTPGNLVKTFSLREGNALPVVMQPVAKGVDPVAWASGNRDLIEKNLLDIGAILFRGFNIRTTEEFESFIETIAGELLEYRERSSPRSQLSGSIYTSTDYPPGESIFLHNENSYQNTWPMKLFFSVRNLPSKVVRRRSLIAEESTNAFLPR